MNATVAFWVALAVLLFWSLGAYNRLVRLRAQVIGSFGPVDQRLEQALVLLAPHAVVEAQAADGSQAPEAADSPATDLDGLHAAAAQLTQSLRIARKQPLDANAVAALKTAYATMHAVWHRHQVGGADRPEPDAAAQADQRAWDNHTQLARDAMDSYNQAVLTYNGAIAQFPAMLLAYLFGFRSAQCL